MKLNKFIKASLVLALAFGSVATIVGCNKNKTVEKSEQEKIYDLYVKYMNAKGETPASYQDWLRSIKGQNGSDGKDGKDGKDGSVWHKGVGAPTNAVVAVKGDYYLDTENKDIYFLGESGWELAIDLEEEEKDKLLAPGVYKMLNEDSWGPLTSYSENILKVNENNDLELSTIERLVYAPNQIITWDENYNMLIPISVDNQNNTLTLGLLNNDSQNSYIDEVIPNLVENKRYMINQNSISFNNGGEILILEPKGYLVWKNGTFTIEEYEVSADYSESLYEGATFKYSFVEEDTIALTMINSGNNDGEEDTTYFKIGEYIENGENSYTEFYPSDTYLPEEIMELAQGTYSDHLHENQANLVTFRKNKVTVRIDDARIIGNYKILDNSEYYLRILVYDDHYEFDIHLDFIGRTFRVNDMYINYTGVYSSSGKSDLNLNHDMKNNKVYLNGKEVKKYLYNGNQTSGRAVIYDETNTKAYQIDVNSNSYREITISKENLLGLIFDGIYYVNSYGYLTNHTHSNNFFRYYNNEMYFIEINGYSKTISLIREQQTVVTFQIENDKTSYISSGISIIFDVDENGSVIDVVLEITQ